MYTFALVLFFGLAVMVVVKLFDRLLRIADEFAAALAVLLGIGAAWLADFDLFASWGFTLRETWIAISFTGLVIGGVAYAFREVVGVIGGMNRKFNDEAIDFERKHDLRRVA